VAGHWGGDEERVISEQQQLDQLVRELSTTAPIAVDTEADSLHAYPERLCLLQVSVPDQDVLIDPLAPLDLAPLLEVLAQKELVFHGADFDLRLLYKSVTFVPTAVFDTMLAARLLGETQFGLAHLVDKYLGVQLDKSLRKANWATRPLPANMADYALNDTRWLLPLAAALRDQLEERSRASWHREWCERTIRDCSCPHPVDADRVWRLKGAHRLAPRALAFLRALWHWREAEAKRANRPPYFVVAHEKLVQLAAAADRFGLAQLRLPPRLSRRRRQGIIEALRTASELPPGQWPEPHSRGPSRPLPQRKASDDALRKRRNARAATLGIDPTIIASRATLEHLAHDWEHHASELMQWQRELLRD
jgi:ribonuclease D